jgi:hypothetical protein
MPLENSQWPVTRKPPGTGRPSPWRMAMPVASSASGVSPQTASCAARGNMPSSQAWQATTLCTQALEPQARPRRVPSSIWVRP